MDSKSSVKIYYSFSGLHFLDIQMDTSLGAAPRRRKRFRFSAKNGRNPLFVVLICSQRVGLINFDE